VIYVHNKAKEDTTMAAKPRFYYGCSLEGMIFDKVCEMIPDHWRSGGSEEGWSRWVSLTSRQSVEVSYQADGVVSQVYWGR